MKSMKLQADIFLPKDMESYEGRLLISLPNYFHVSRMPQGFQETKYKGADIEGKVEMKKRTSNTLFIDVKHDAERMPVRQGWLSNKIDGSASGYKNLDESFVPNETLLKVLRELGILDSENKPAVEFDVDVARRVLKFFRNGFEFESHDDDRTFDYFIENKKGNCRDFSESFAQMIYLSGGLSRTFGQYPVMCEKHLFGKPFASKSDSKIDAHKFTLVKLNGGWEIIDPTIYFSSPEGIEDRAIRMSPYPLFYEFDFHVEMGDALTDTLRADKRLQLQLEESYGRTIFPERNLDNYYGKSCDVSVSFPEEPIEEPPTASP